MDTITIIKINDNIITIIKVMMEYMKLIATEAAKVANIFTWNI